ncbi:IS701 family transposase [Streptomyces sp. NPDC088755]|uniref:IS701 family transposase n=1 Tax=Streptomyces sp. NPDC088755 TaxID=3365888 RepID=UPI00380D3DAD
MAMSCTQSSDAASSRPAADPESSFAHFTETVFSSLRRADQRRWAHTYVEALLNTPGKKSIRRLAQTVSTSPTTVQSLRQLVSLSPWDWDPVLYALTRWADRHGPDPVCAIGRASLPKRGESSVGVHRYFDLSSGRALNGQLALGAFMCFGPVQVPVDWRLHLPVEWTEDERLRRRTRIPDTMPYRPMWAQALQLIDTLGARTGSMSAPIVADMSSDPDVALLIHGLGRRGRDFVMAVPHNLTVLPVGESEQTTIAQLVARPRASLGAPEMVVVTAPDGSSRSTRVHAGLVHLTGTQRRPVGPPHRLFAEILPGSRPGHLWVTSLTQCHLGGVASLAALASCTTSAVEHMERDFGLLDFEGRSLPGWYHHMVLVSAAYVYQGLAHRSSPGRAEQHPGSDPKDRGEDA